MIARESNRHAGRASLGHSSAARRVVPSSLSLAVLSCVIIGSAAMSAGTQLTPMASPTAVHAVPAAASTQALLSNIESALRDGSLLSGAFYADGHLRQFFGAAGVTWILNTDTDKYGKLIGVTYIPVLTKSPARLGVTWIRLDSQQKKNATGKAHAAISIACSCALRIEAIEKAFGARNRSVQPDRRLEGTHAPRPRDPTHPLGNQIVTYHIDTSTSRESTLSVAFDPDGNITLIEARQREK